MPDLNRNGVAILHQIQYIVVFDALRYTAAGFILRDPVGQLHETEAAA
jgi:hypothetical protein